MNFYDFRQVMKHQESNKNHASSKHSSKNLYSTIGLLKDKFDFEIENS